MAKVKITKVPENQSSDQAKTVKRTLKPVAKEKANLEAEKGEVVMTPGEGGIPEVYIVGGKRHYAGGTPLNLAEHSFIFSDTKDMKIKDPVIQKAFGLKEDKNGYTPAEIAKKYMINDYLKILKDPDSDKLQRTTAEQMIKNRNMELSKLALVQESTKGFPNGLPMVAMPYVEAMQIDPTQFIQQEEQEQPQAFKEGGEKKKVRVMQLRKFDEGAPVTLPKDAVVINSMEEADALIKKGVDPKNIFFKTPEGKYKRPVIKKGIKEDYDFGTLDPQLLELTDEQTAQAYNYMKSTIESNADLKADIVTTYREKLDALKPTKILSQKAIDEAKKLSPEDIMNNFFNMQKQVYVAAKEKRGTQTWDPKDSWDKDRGNYINWAKSKGFTPLNDVQGTSFQGVFSSLTDLAADPKYTETLNQFNIEPVGYADEPGSHTKAGQKNISNIDSWIGNTTVLQAVTPKATRTDWEDYTQEPVAKVDKKENVPFVQNQQAPWWLQDIIGTNGAVADYARIKKYTPWQAAPELAYPDPTFYDPERELAANAENAMIASQELSQFTGPQAFNSRFNQIQGAAAKNAADTLSRYNNLNVGIANQFENQIASIKTQASANKSANATQLHDKYAIVNQQFDNARNQARQEIRNKVIQAVTNRANTYNLNSIYDNFYTDPSSGGLIHKNPYYTKLKPTQDGTSNLDKFIKAKELYPGVSDQVLYKLLGFTPDNNQLPDEEDDEMKAYMMQNMYPGLYGNKNQ